MVETSIPKRPRGRPRKDNHKFAISLPYDLGEWAKEQPEGLSGLVEALLSGERRRREKRERMVGE